MKIFTGTVISVKNAKTAVVAVTRLVSHPVYQKRVKKTKKFQVHDEAGVSVGQRVDFIASKPFSKTKKWAIYTGSETATKPAVEEKKPKVKKVAVTAAKKKTTK